MAHAPFEGMNYAIKVLGEGGAYAALKNIEDALKALKTASIEGIPLLAIGKNENVTHDDLGNILIEVGLLKGDVQIGSMYLRDNAGTLEMSADGSTWQAIGADVTPEDIGAARQIELDAHTGDNTNPHAVTAAQVGAATPAELTTKMTIADYDPNGYGDRVLAADRLWDGGSHIVGAATIADHLDNHPGGMGMPLWLLNNGNGNAIAYNPFFNPLDLATLTYIFDNLPYLSIGGIIVYSSSGVQEIYLQRSTNLDVLLWEFGKDASDYLYISFYDGTQLRTLTALSALPTIMMEKGIDVGVQLDIASGEAAFFYGGLCETAQTPGYALTQPNNSSDEEKWTVGGQFDNGGFFSLWVAQALQHTPGQYYTPPGKAWHQVRNALIHYELSDYNYNNTPGTLTSPHSRCAIPDINLVDATWLRWEYSL